MSFRQNRNKRKGSLPEFMKLKFGEEQSVSVRKRRLKQKGSGINLEAALSSAVLIFAAVQLLILVRTRLYLNYVTPRMKPYLYALSVLMLLWAVMAGKQLFFPRYQVRISKPLFLFLPMLLMTMMPREAQGSSLMKDADADSFRIQTVEEQGQLVSKALQTETDGRTVLPEETEGLFVQGETEAVNYSGSDTDIVSDTVSGSEMREALPGLDEVEKRITIADETYYDWIMEISMNYQKYIGYTVRMEGFVYRGEDMLSQADFALVRLSMWCCSADLTPLGFLIQSEKEAAFTNDAWVTVTGTLSVNEDETAIVLYAKDIQPAQEPAETFVYPSYF